MDRIIIFDTTLRDGEQSPGASLTSQEKLKIAHQLARLGVDVIEAGFPVASEDEAAAVKAIAESVTGPAVCALARCRETDIDAALRSLEKGKLCRLHLFLATSEIHRRYKLGKAKTEILKIAVETVRRARRHIGDIEFSPEDATRTEPEFLAEIAQAVAAEGARTINIPDTVGYTTPQEFGTLIGILRGKLAPEIVISVHCHNDLGLAVANSLAALVNGARQVECTVNGIGERAGNASMEEIVMSLVVRKAFYRLQTGVVTREIYRTSKLVSSLTGIPVQPNKAVVGANAFRHESGIHQDGVLKCRRTYEIMSSRMVGIPEHDLVLGKHSGRHALRIRLGRLGFHLDERDFEAVYLRFKELADKKKEVSDLDLVVVAEEVTSRTEPVYELSYFHILSGSSTVPSATVKLKKENRLLEDAARGDGPVDAVYKAIDRITGMSPVLEEYRIAAVTGGKDAQGEVTVAIQTGGVRTAGKCVSTDIIEASAKAYLDAVNQYLSKRKRGKRKTYRAA